MNQSMDRELGQFQQKLENTASNVDNMRQDLGKLFDAIDDESKSQLREVARVEGKIDIHVSTDLQEKDVIKVNVKENKGAIDDLKRQLTVEKDARIVLETKSKTGARIAQIIAGVLGLLATIISVITAIIK